jgi:hypothetical protein
MAGDRKIFSDKGKEKAPSQSHTRDFTRQQSQPKIVKRIELDKNRVIVEGGMNQVGQRRIERIKEAENRAMSRDNRGSHVNKKHGDLSDRGKEKASSQSKPRNFTKKQYQQNVAKSLELNKSRGPLKGGGGVWSGWSWGWEEEKLLEEHDVARRKLKKSSDEDTTEQQ